MIANFFYLFGLAVYEWTVIVGVVKIGMTS